MFRPLLGHLQGLWENRSKRCLRFNALWDPKCLQILLQECKIHKFVYIEILCDGLSISRLKIIRYGSILKPTVYKRLYNNLFLLFSFQIVNFKGRVLHLSVIRGTYVFFSSMARRQDEISLPVRSVISWCHYRVFLQTKSSMQIFLYGWVAFAVLYQGEEIVVSQRCIDFLQTLVVEVKGLMYVVRC